MAKRLMAIVFSLLMLGSAFREKIVIRQERRRFCVELAMAGVLSFNSVVYLCALPLAASAQALIEQEQRQEQICAGAQVTPDDRIAACTALIRTGHQTTASKAYLYRGQAYELSGRHRQAIADFTQAITLRPDFDEAYGLRGDAYAANSQYDAAIDDYTKALAINPADDSRYVSRGLVFEKKGNTTAAINNYREALRFAPNPVAKAALERLGASTEVMGPTRDILPAPGINIQDLLKTSPIEPIK
jgi:tetratricopeptide (TPR) repeat protein